ncbi:hypothetical protein ACQV2B_19105 [Pantoea allii]|uniref:hypothetical protein n=1 Tax=Pantoea allii TaxID=574096 RepID=UPI003D31282B
MKMTDKELNQFQDATNAAYGAEVIIGLMECHPNKLSDEEIIAITGVLKSVLRPVVVFMIGELKSHGIG